MLTPPQRADLHQAVVNYVAKQGHATEDLCEKLGIQGPNEQPVDLEQKWTALVRLQRRILDLEQENAKLQAELRLAANAAPADAQLPAADARAPHVAPSLANWLPKWPPRRTLLGHRSRVNALAFHPEWSLLASGDDQSEIKVWDTESGELERTLRAHTRAVHGVCFSARSRLLASCSADLSVKVFDPKQDFANVRTLVGHEHTVSAVLSFQVSPELGGAPREYLASASRDRTVRLWELDTGFPVAVLRDHSDWVRCLGSSSAKLANGEFPVLISAGSDRTVVLRVLFAGDGGAQGAPAAPVVFRGGHTHVIECCAVAPAASAPFLARHVAPERADVACAAEVYFATGGRDLQVCVWSSRCREPILRLKGHENWVQALDFHPSGRFLVSVGDDKTMRVWDLASGRLVRTIAAHDHFVTCMAWRGKSLASGSVDASVRLW